MKLGTAITVAVLCVTASMSFAGTLTYTPNPSDLYDLDHTQYYAWGISKTWSSTEAVVSATLTFKNMSNWDNNPNKLYVHLLDNPLLGVHAGTDNEGGGDNFAGQGILLTTYVNLSTTPQTRIYTFDAAEVAGLNTYANNNGIFGLGFDPDCHYFNDGIKLTLCTEQIPEPATMSLLAAGAMGVLLRRRNRRHDRTTSRLSA